MRKITLLLALILTAGFSTESFAQVTATDASKTMNVEIVELLSITVNEDAWLIYDDPVDFTAGVDSLFPGHLTVSSTKDFDVYVETAAADLINANTTDVIPVNYVQVNVILQGSQTLGTLSPQNLATSNGSNLLIDNAPPAMGESIDVEYSINPTFSQQLIGLDAEVYSQAMTYTIVAQ